MVTMLIDSVFAIGIVIPDGIGEVFELVTFGPTIDFFAMAFVLSYDFLKKHEVAACLPQTVANAVQSEAPVSGREALVNIESQYLEILHERFTLAGVDIGQYQSWLAIYYTNVQRPSWRVF